MKIDPGPTSGLGLREVGREVGGVVTQASQNRRIEFGGEGLHDPLEGRNPHEMPTSNGVVLTARFLVRVQVGELSDMSSTFDCASGAPGAALSSTRKS
jgi:hypothetical protein